MSCADAAAYAECKLGITGYIGLSAQQLQAGFKWDASGTVIEGVDSCMDTSDYASALQVIELMVTVGPLALRLRGMSPPKAIFPYQFGNSRESQIFTAYGLALVDWSKATLQHVSDALAGCDIWCKSNVTEWKQAQHLAAAMTAYLQRKGIPLLDTNTECKDVFPYNSKGVKRDWAD